MRKSFIFAICCFFIQQVGAIDVVKLTPEACKKICSDCKSVANKQRCTTQCPGLADTTACQMIHPQAMSAADANNLGSINFNGMRDKLMQMHPEAADIIENPGKAFSKVDPNLGASAQVISATVGVLKGVRRGAAEVFERIKGRTNSQSDLQTLQQFQHVLGQIDIGIQTIERQRGWRVGELRKQANDILLLEKNMYNQGATQVYTAAKKSSAMSKFKNAAFCKLQCRAAACGKSLATFTKCMTSCEPGKIQNCIKSAQKGGKPGQSIYNQYQNWLQTHRMGQAN